jgi:hypothetical protein
MSDQPTVPQSARVEDVDLSGRRVHGANLEGARFTETYLAGASIWGDIEGLVVNGVEIEPLVRAELDRRNPERVRLRARDANGLREAWSMVESLWASATDRATRLPDEIQRRRVDDEWSFVETLRHLVFATDCWLSRGIDLDPHPYHRWGVAWSGAGLKWSTEVGLDISANPTLAEMLPIRTGRQSAVRDTLHRLTDGELAEVRTAPETPGHPSGDHSVLQCLHVILNEEWQHHRYATRDLDLLSVGIGADP